MTAHSLLTVMREQVDADAARARVAALCDHATVSVEGSVLYPYFWFAARCKVRMMAGHQDISVACAVDGVNGIGATADPVPTDNQAASDALVLQSKISTDVAKRTAERTLTHQLGRKFRTIATFDVSLDSIGTIYKRFWIVRVGDSRVMTDSVTGIVQPLSANAA